MPRQRRGYARGKKTYYGNLKISATSEIRKYANKKAGDKISCPFSSVESVDLFEQHHLLHIREISSLYSVEVNAA